MPGQPGEETPMTTLRARARSMLNPLGALPMIVAISLILDHARRW
jgi:hypothetical protein